MEPMTHQANGPAGTSSNEPAVDAAIETVEQQLSMLWRRSRSDSHKVARQVHPDMEPAAYGLLLILQREGSMRLTDLAGAIGIGKPSVSRQVALLEQLGLIRKDADPLDGRAQAISLTPNGINQLRAAQTARKKAFHGVMADWKLEDLKDLGRLLRQLNDTYASDHQEQRTERDPGAPPAS